MNQQFILWTSASSFSPPTPLSPPRCDRFLPFRNDGRPSQGTIKCSCCNRIVDQGCKWVILGCSSSFTTLSLVSATSSPETASVHSAASLLLDIIVQILRFCLLSLVLLTQSLLAPLLAMMALNNGDPSSRLSPLFIVLIAPKDIVIIARIQLLQSRQRKNHLTHRSLILPSSVSPDSPSRSSSQSSLPQPWCNVNSLRWVHTFFRTTACIGRCAQSQSGGCDYTADGSLQS